jgi:hypothetical protein
MTSALLILVFSTSAFACASGWSGTSDGLCSAPRTRRACAIKAGSTCGRSFQSQHDKCSLRSFSQLRTAVLQKFQMSGPLLHAAGKASRPADPLLTLLSIGPSETDRGPPRS